MFKPGDYGGGYPPSSSVGSSTMWLISSLCSCDVSKDVLSVGTMMENMEHLQFQAICSILRLVYRTTELKQGGGRAVLLLITFIIFQAASSLILMQCGDTTTTVRSLT